MARRPLTGDVRVITDHVNQVTEGEVLGSRQVDTGKDKPQTAWALKDKTGDVFEIWGSAQINNALGRVKRGTYVWITYNGKKPSRRGEMHDFMIEFDDETGEIGGGEGTYDPGPPDDYPDNG